MSYYDVPELLIHSLTDKLRVNKLLNTIAKIFQRSFKCNYEIDNSNKRTETETERNRGKGRRKTKFKSTNNNEMKSLVT